jgi:hypothetical protein
MDTQMRWLDATIIKVKLIRRSGEEVERHKALQINGK